MAHRAEGSEKQQEDQGECDRNDDSKPCGGPLLVLELATPGQHVPLRQLDLFRNYPLGFIDKTHEIATTHVALYECHPTPVLAVDLDRPIDAFERRD